jgi:stringent starvation protein B
MTDELNMTSNRPYLLRAFYQWIVDNECTPYIVVEADLPNVEVPPQTVRDGQVVLNISPSAVQNLLLEDEQVTFSARFGGVPFEVYIPVYAISAVYARENGAGTMFPPEEIPELASTQVEEDVEEPSISVVETSSDAKSEKPAEKSKSKGSHLKVIK